MCVCGGGGDGGHFDRQTKRAKYLLLLFKAVKPFRLFTLLDQHQILARLGVILLTVKTQTTTSLRRERGVGRNSRLVASKMIALEQSLLIVLFYVCASDSVTAGTEVAQGKKLLCSTLEGMSSLYKRK